MKILKNLWVETYYGFITLTMGHFMSIPDSWNKGKKHLILIPGINESFYSLKFLADHFNSKGYMIHVPLKGLLHDDIQELADEVIEYVTQHNIQTFEILAHSKGGLVGKHVLDVLANKKNPIRLWSLSTPYKGLYAGYLPIWNLKQMRTGHEYIANAYKNKKNNQNIISIYPRFDELLYPANSHLEEAQNYKINEYGHLAVCYSEETIELIDQFIG